MSRAMSRITSTATNTEVNLKYVGGNVSVFMSFLVLKERRNEFERYLLLSGLKYKKTTYDFVYQISYLYGDKKAQKHIEYLTTKFDTYYKHKGVLK